ncbi:hypothetical protein OS493_037225 [Desmophyllum pertusum]|uniref:Ig-like domain-containing protein n=1 Tax=Desmophyllum pertusum TaxID=174260 RepID=A0A9X0D6D2_9CNID|nr:hypothetical protein OS493_037225 [Desmophyllum pertusum]
MNPTLEVEYLWTKNAQPLDGTKIATVLKLENVTEESAERAHKCQASNKRGSTVSNVTILRGAIKGQISREQPTDAPKGLVGDEIFSMVCPQNGSASTINRVVLYLRMKGDNHDAVRVKHNMRQKFFKCQT